MPALTKTKAIATAVVKQLNSGSRDVICQKSTASNNRLSYVQQSTLWMSSLCLQQPLLRQLYDRDFDCCCLHRGFFVRRRAICELVGRIAARIELTQGYG
ncbi:hypothetical protein IQ270_27230 [Microcoleus sp. LEGE 07076]|uniref:hypothetical protein n=1 Tax=Microcoleus sp. LEGE 07076 TaxID=915322 RepID=UPI0018815688|nr:hypothetical protein [Microcoleus sp. LEGE 07076]MBE9188231.1 hypothetical protein [Microcoleus sp. LEGE 07076]